MKLTISVTKEDIAKGKPVNAMLCPIALALKRLGVVCVCISGFEASGEYRNKFYKGELPKEAVDFTYSFDRQLPVKPMKFTLNLTQ